MAFADYTSQGAVAVITLKNPPVNALGVGLRKAIADGVERAANDASIRAMVIVGSGNAFCGGADVSEFGRPVMGASPSLWDLFALIENSPWPVTIASRRRPRRSDYPRSSWGFCRAQAARSGCRGWWAWSGR